MNDLPRENPDQEDPQDLPVLTDVTVSMELMVPQVLTVAMELTERKEKLVTLVPLA